MAVDNKSFFVGLNQKPGVAPWRMSNKHVNFEQIDQNLLAYLDTLPVDVQKSIYVTSSTGDEHSKNSRHYSGRALDLRLNNKTNPEEDPLFAYLGKDVTRKDKKIVVLDPNHGSAPHVHLSYGDGTENANDYFYGKKATAQSNAPIVSSSVPEQGISNPGYVPTITADVNNGQALFEEFRQLLSESNKQQEKEAESTKLLAAKEALANKQADLNAKLSFIKEVKLSYSTTDYSGSAPAPKFENGGRFDFVRNQTPNVPTNFEQRMYHTPHIDNEDESMSTHKMMSWSDAKGYYAAPTVVMVDGKLVELGPEEAIQYAYKTGELKTFKSDAEAQAYANNGYKQNTPMEVFAPNEEYRPILSNGGSQLKKNPPSKTLNIDGSKEEVMKIQAQLKTAGYALSKSIDAKGQFDGIAGKETRSAYFDLLRNTGRYQAYEEAKKEIIPRSNDFSMSAANYPQLNTTDIKEGFFKNTKTIEDVSSALRYHNEGGRNCAGGVCRATQDIMPQLGVEGLTDLKTKYGISSGKSHPRFNDYGESPDAWDLPGLLREKGARALYTAKSTTDIDKMPDAEFGEMIKKFPIGTVLNYGDILNKNDPEQKYTKAGYNAKQGMVSGNHLATVVAYNDQGYPITYDYGRYRVLSKNSYGGLVSATVPKEYEKYTYEFLKSSGKLSKSFEYKDAQVNDTAAMNKMTKEGAAVDKEQLGAFISTLKEQKKTLLKDLESIGSNQEYDNLVKMASSIAMAETKGGAANGIGTWADNLGLGKSLGLTQINGDTLFKDPILKAKLSKYNITRPDDLKIPEKSAIATMVYLASVKSRAEGAYSKGTVPGVRKFRYDDSMSGKVRGSNSVYIEEIKGNISLPSNESDAQELTKTLKARKLDTKYAIKKDTKGYYLEKKTQGNSPLTIEQKIAYYWNTPNTLASGDAQGNNAYVKKVMDYYKYFN